MKIFCIGRNYADHAKELNNPVPKQPIVFMKPPTALLINGRPFYYPDFTKDLHYECEIVLKIGRNGRCLQPRFGERYIAAVGLGIDFTARDIQKRCKDKGHPWEIAKAFDYSAPISEFIPYTEWQGKDIPFTLEKNGEVVQNGSTADLIFDFGALISYVSKFFTLKMGDLIFTGTPAGVGPVKIGDKLRGYIDGKEMLKCDIR